MGKRGRKGRWPSDSRLLRVDDRGESEVLRNVDKFTKGHEKGDVF